MGRAKRIERVVALTKLLADHPYRLFRSGRRSTFYSQPS